MKKFIFMGLFLAPFYSFSQFSDHFSDGKFNNPGQTRSVEWSGDTEKFGINDALQLQLNAPKDGSPAQLRTSSSRLANTSWEWWMKMNFNPTSSNYTRIYLCSDSEDLTGELKGLFIRLGHTSKNLCLISQNGKTSKTLISGSEKRLDLASVALRVKATLDKNGQFCLYSQLDGETEYTLEGTCSVTDLPTSNWFGIYCYYSSTRNSHFFFDDFVVKPLNDEEEKPDPEFDKPDALDIVINEILFNPPSGGNEYMELYNRSNKTINLRYLSITSRKPSDGSLNKAYALSSVSQEFNPGEYIVVTKNKDLVCSFFQCRPETFYTELSVMPSLANTSGCAVLLNNQTGQIVDEFAYNEKMHAEGISNKKGIALERLDPDVSSSDPSNWHSASAETGYGTPGYPNSQQKQPSGTEDEITISNPDITIDSYRIHYRFSSPGYRCKAFVYDSQGRLIHSIANNELLGTEGTLYWNGKRNSGQSLPAGIYIIYMEVYNMKGVVKKFKKPAVVRGKGN